MSETITYDVAAWMQTLTDVKTNKKYFMLGRVTNAGIKDTFAVTPVGGKGETVFFCNKHGVAYGPKEFCIDCRMQVVGESAE